MPRCLPSRTREELDDYELDVYVKSALCNRAQDILVGPGLDKVRGNCKIFFFFFFFIFAVSLLY